MIEGKSLDEAFALFSQETKRLEHAYLSLRNEFKHLRLTLDAVSTHLSEGLLFITSGGIITLFNPAAEKITGLCEADVIGKSFSTHFSDVFFGFSFQEYLKRPLPKQGFLTLGSSLEIEVSLSPVPGKGVTIFLKDLTEMKRLKRAVERNERLKELGEMAAALAHEIRNPLGGIEGFASLLLDDLQEYEDARKKIAYILEGTKQLNRLVTNIVDYARPLEPHLIPTDLVSLVQETCSLLKADRKIKTDLLFRSALPFFSCYADPTLFKGALLNVCLNAIQASPPGKKVHVSIDERGTIKVHDHGSGIAPENLEKIFTPFFTTKSRGTGLGLSETQKIIAAHGGKIEMESQVGKGTTVTIKLQEQHEN